ncbi:hypothetical protein EJB05_41935, partial [Eragrostis curvula]
MADCGDGVAVPGDRERLQKLFLAVARVLMLCGAVSMAGSPGGNAGQAFLCLLLWLLVVCFLAFGAAAGRFPRAA